jgi:uncharacterized repeat protein (TIGR03809 family)
MTDQQALRRFNKTAEKWRDLAEKRRLYFEELHQSGRWKYYYTETLFFRRLGKATELVELWEPVLKAQLPETSPAPQSPTMLPATSALTPLPKSAPMSSPKSPMRELAPPRRRAI